MIAAAGVSIMMPSSTLSETVIPLFFKLSLDFATHSKGFFYL